MAVLPRPVTMMMFEIPEWMASSTPYWMRGLSTSGSISLGMALVAGKNRVPNPAAGKTALRTFASIPSQFRSSERPYASGRTERVPQSDILEPVGGFSSLEYRGCRLAYRVTGAGPPLVWIQGVG